MQIFEQFQSNNWVRNGQVLWSGVPRVRAQKWADTHHLQTLTTAMGPLMDERNSDCPKSKKSLPQWSNYIHGASAIFAWHIARGDEVTVLSPPPPDRFHPSGLSNYQAIEEPIIQGLLGQCAVQHIIMVHPTVTESEAFVYEMWPKDESPTWIKRFGLRSFGRKWREIGRCEDKLQLRQLIASEKKQSNEESLNRRYKSKGVTEAKNQDQTKQQEKTIQKLKTQIKAGDKALEETEKKLKSKQKSEVNVQEEARQNRKAKKKVEAHEKARQIFNAQMKAKAEAHEKVGRKLEAKQKAETNAHEEARRMLKVKQKAEVKVREESRQNQKAKKKAQVEAHEKARQRFNAQMKAKAEAHEEVGRKFQSKKKAEVKTQEKAEKKLDESKRKSVVKACFIRTGGIAV